MACAGGRDRRTVLRPDYEKLFQAISSPYTVLDAGLNFVAVNAEYERVTMRPAAACLGRNVFEMFPNGGKPAGGEAVRVMLRRRPVEPPRVGEPS